MSARRHFKRYLKSMDAQKEALEQWSTRIPNVELHLR